MEKPSLFIHVGAYKTGTTSIQQFMNSKNLRKRVFMFPQVDFDCLCSGSQSINGQNKGLEHLKKQINKCVTRAKRDIYLISNERLSGDIFSFFGNAGEIAGGLHFVTKDFFRSITVIVYVREQTQWLHSVYTQQIHQGEAYDYNNFCCKIKSNTLDWNRLIKPYQETFGSQNVRVKQYDDEIIEGNGGLICDFVQEMGLSTEMLDISLEREYNKSYSRTALALALQTNQHLTLRQKQNFRRQIQNAEMMTAKVKFSFLTRSQLNAEKDVYSALNQNSLLHHFEPGTILFPSKQDVFCADELEPISDRDLLALLTKIYFSSQTSDLVALKIIAYLEERLRDLGAKIPVLGKLLRRINAKLTSWCS